MKVRGKRSVVTVVLSVTVGSMAVYAAAMAEEPAAQTQADQKPAEQTQAAQKPADQKPADQKKVAKKSDKLKPADQKSAAAQPAAAAPAAADPVAAAPAAADAVAAAPAEPEQKLWPAIATDEIAKEHGGVDSWGNIEAGGRFFIERPPSGGAAWVTPSIQRPQGQSIAKYEEYGNVPEGLYLERLYVGGQTKDAEYYVDLRATDVGNNNQRYIFDWAKTGDVSGTITWDQIPHLYSTSAQSIWNGVGTNFLTTNVQLGSLANGPNNNLINQQLAANLHTITIGIERDKFETDNRWTPSPDWDIKLDYSHEHRDGTQVAGVVWGGPGGPEMVQVPRPVDDTTQQGRMSVERTGEWLYGKWNVKLTGSVSLYDDAYTSYTVQNPFAQIVGPNIGCGSSFTTPSAPCALVSLPPSNQAYTANLTSGVDLPWASRWMNTVQYQSLQQNDPFQAMTSSTGTVYTATGALNPAVVAAGATTAVPAGSLRTALAEPSLNGDVEILLVNSVIHTQITQDLKSTLKYRFYDNDNETPVKTWNWTTEDYANSADTRNNFGYSYSKQEASEDLTWHFLSNGAVGGQAGWEQIDRDKREALTTNEYMGQLHSDVRFDDIGMFRASYGFGERRYDQYDPAAWYATLYPNATLLSPSQVATIANDWGMRKFDLANRDRQKAMLLFSFDNIPYIPNLTITPSAGLRFDHYLTDTSTPITTPSGDVVYEMGLLKDNQWNAGIEAAYAFKPGTSIVLAYVHEDYDKVLVGSPASGNIVTGAVINVPGVLPDYANGVPSRFYSNMKEDVDTFIVGGNVALNDSWDWTTSYSISFGNENWSALAFGPTSDCTTGNPVSDCQPFPAVVTNAQRIDTVLRYKVAPEVVTKLGFSGDVYWKIKYSWDHLRMSNWQNDLATPYMYLVDSSNDGRNINMAAYNPNYDVHVVATSLNLKW